MRLRLLGKFSLTSAGHEVVMPGLRSRALLAFLACNMGKAYTRERLAALFWGERSEDQARQSLRQALSAIRRSLGADMLIAEHYDVALAADFSCDVQEFQALIAAGGREGLLQAVDLYEDDLLRGFPFDEAVFMEWLETERTRLRNLALEALEALIGRESPDMTSTQLLEYAHRALEIDRFREAAHRQILRALASIGRRNDALMHYRQLEHMLHDELGVPPEPATRAVYEAVRSGEIAAPSVSSAPAATRRPAQADKPAVAVLPFDNLGGDASMARIADGITEDIITDLARFRGIDVIARNSTAVYKSKSADARQVGRDLDTHYVLLGTIQCHARRVRITAQLLDASAGTTLWSDRWDRPDKALFKVQAEVAEAVAVTIGGMSGSAAIMAEEIRKARRRSPESLTAYHYYLLANEGRSLFTKESVLAGIQAADKAIALEPTLGRAYVARAWLSYITAHYGGDFAAALDGMEADATCAVELDPYDAEARVALGFCLSCRGRFEESEAQIDAALQANPANAQVMAVAAAMRPWNGYPEGAGALADKVLRLDPWMTAANLNCVKDAYFFTRRFEDVIAVVSRIPLRARGKGAWLMLTLSYALLAQNSRARRARADLLARYPAISAELLFNQDWCCARSQEENLILEGFAAADLPLCASDDALAGLPNLRRLPACVLTS